MSLLAEKLPALLARSRTPSGMRLLGCVEGAEISYGAIASSDARLVSFAGLSQIDASQCRYSVLPVPAVLLCRCLAQIFPAIVGTVAIFVIERMGCAFRLHLPDYALRFVHLAIDVNRNIPVCHLCACDGASPSLVPSAQLRSRVPEMAARASFPRQQTRLWIVVKALAQIGCSGQQFSFQGGLP